MARTAAATCTTTRTKPTTSRPGPLGRTMQVAVELPERRCGSLVFEVGAIVTICVGLDRPGSSCRSTISTDCPAHLPPRGPRPGSTVFSDFLWWQLFSISKPDHVVTSTNNRQIWVLGETAAAPDPGLEVLRTYEPLDVRDDGDCSYQRLPDWRGLSGSCRPTPSSGRSARDGAVTGAAARR